nr:MAG TPA: hypothetical protein [Caudoviricetes sp.]
MRFSRNWSAPASALCNPCLSPPSNRHFFSMLICTLT